MLNLEVLRILWEISNLWIMVHLFVWGQKRCRTSRLRLNERLIQWLRLSMYTTWLPTSRRMYSELATSIGNTERACIYEQLTPHSLQRYHPLISQRKSIVYRAREAKISKDTVLLKSESPYSCTLGTSDTLSSHKHGIQKLQAHLRSL